MTDTSHTFGAYYKRATSPLVVLHLLRDGPQYGYELTQAMKRRSGGRFTIALLYPILYRLEEQGYVKIDRTEIVNNRARSYYAVTPEGLEYLERSLREYREMDDAFWTVIGGKENEQRE